FATVDRQWLGHALLDSLYDYHHFLYLGQIFQDNGEFVAGETCNCVAGTKALSKPVGDFHQHFVASEVAQAVVDGFEAVEVQEDDGEMQVGSSLRAGDGGLKAVHEQGSVGEGGQPVVECVVLELFFHG